MQERGSDWDTTESLFRKGGSRIDLLEPLHLMSVWLETGNEIVYLVSEVLGEDGGEREKGEE